MGPNSALASYHDSMDFGFIANTAAIGDPTRLAHLTMRAYEELTQAAGTRSAQPIGVSC
ncbi:WSD1 family O-acyltransferase [Mycobacterium ostraviense]|uniref:hypothetical protein n=1 Tax=Mycobacterium ostraviense TaxID=2738409 RepID=UPI0011569D76|nr:hypothetical protein [Mycobacterium ostraviense]UGT94246.1 WSD1 family O-acyltransferase [Mycobacterium ostraviense]